MNDPNPTSGPITVSPALLTAITGRPVTTRMDPADYELARVEVGPRAADALHDQNSRTR
jgi:hypothetical protein